jgi:hypothetical protein
VADAVGGEGQIGRHPFGENAAFLWSDIPGVPGGKVREGLTFEVREGDGVRETLISWVRGRREPKRSESPREQEAPVRINPSGSSKRSTAFPMGVSRWSVGTRPGRVS